MNENQHQVIYKTSWLVLNYNCNNRCKWCYVKEHLDTKPKQMPLQLAKNSIDLMKSLGVRKVVLIGGEPTVYPNLVSVIEYAKKNGIRAGIVTNGRLLSDESLVKSMVAAGLDMITVSIEGSCSPVHDGITKVEGSFVETMGGIRNALKENLKVSTETTMCKENLHDLPRILDMLYETGVKCPEFNFCINSIEAKNESIIDIETCARLREELYNYAKSSGKHVRFVIPIPICSYSKELRDEILEKGVAYSGCHMHMGTAFVIDYNGDILPCVRFSGHSLGNIIKNRETSGVMSREEFTDFWENREGRTFREKLWRFPSKKCQLDKKYWGACIGGCPLLWLTFDPRNEIKGIN